MLNFNFILHFFAHGAGSIQGGLCLGLNDQIVLGFSHALQNLKSEKSVGLYASAIVFL